MSDDGAVWRWRTRDGCRVGRWHKPYEPGLRWVKEQWRAARSLDKWNATQIVHQCVEEAGYEKPWAPIRYEADVACRDWYPADDWGGLGRLRQARFMPRWASRLTIEITSVRVERLQDITLADAEAEGVECRGEHLQRAWTNYLPDGPHCYTARESYITRWDQINGKKPGARWADNPFVFVVSFRVVPPEEQR